MARRTLRLVSLEERLVVDVTDNNENENENEPVEFGCFDETRANGIAARHDDNVRL
jgi:hypothetical protein